MSPGGFLCPQRPLLHTAATHVSQDTHVIDLGEKNHGKFIHIFSLRKYCGALVISDSVPLEYDQF